MSLNFNKVILMGNLTRDPQLRYLANLTPRSRTSPLPATGDGKVLTAKTRKKSPSLTSPLGASQPKSINQYFQKGKPVLEGRLKFDTQEDKQGGGKRPSSPSSSKISNSSADAMVSPAEVEVEVAVVVGTRTMQETIKRVRRARNSNRVLYSATLRRQRRRPNNPSATNNNLRKTTSRSNGFLLVTGYLLTARNE